MTQPVIVTSATAAWGSARAHIYKPLVDETGTIYTYATVTVYEEDGNTPYAGTIYRTESSPDTWPNPYVAAPAVVDLYLAKAARVVLGITLTDGSPETRTEPIDAVPDPAQMVTSAVPIVITGSLVAGAMLSVSPAGFPFWRQLKIDHQHSLDPSGATLFLGTETGFGPQDATFTGSTVLGTGAGVDVPPSGLTDATSVGSNAVASGSRTTALGAAARASEGPGWPWVGDGVAIGSSAFSRAEGVAVGHLADATATDDGTGEAVSLGREALGDGPHAVSLGTFGHAGEQGVSVGWNTGQSSWGAIGSVALGADCQLGLPTTTDASHFSVLLGAHDPRADVVFPWANPRGSQSESPLAEYLPTMQFEAKTLQFQRHLTTVLAGLLTSPGDATFGREGSRLAFYGATPQPQLAVGDDEPTSGIEALDSLIYALRDLGLLRYRHEAMTIYQAADMLPFYGDGDDVTTWYEHHGDDVATTLDNPPSFVENDQYYNGRPAVYFDNGVQMLEPRPREALLGQNLLTGAKHVLVAARHERTKLGQHEGLVNLAQTGAHTAADDIVLQSQGFATTCWDDAGHTASYTRDDLHQGWNLDARPNGAAHVYRMTNLLTWPTATLVLGAPADGVNPSVYDSWRGSISTVAVLDSSWAESDVDSMTFGMMFRDRIAQDDCAVIDPATDFIVKQHDPLSGVKIRMDCDYSDDFLGTVSGEVYGVTTGLVDVPWVSIWDWFECYEYWGPIVGYWGNLPDTFDHDLWYDHDWDDWERFKNPYRRYHVQVTTQRKNHIVDIAESEWLFGFCWLEDEGTWSTGFDWTRRGYKTAYLIDRFTGETLAVSGNPSQKFGDIEVRGYITNSDGSLTQVGTSPLWCDRAFRIVFPQTGHKVIRVYQLSTGTVLASTEWQERSLPRALVASQDDPDYAQGMESVARTYDAAVAVMALCERGSDYYPRARVILSTLVSVMNDDGSINDTYDSLFPQKGAGISSARSVVWFGLALMYYQSATGDDQFFPAVQSIARWMFAHQHDGLMPASGTDSSYRTDDNVSAYFFFQRYSDVIAEISS